MSFVLSYNIKDGKLDGQTFVNLNHVVTITKKNDNEESYYILETTTGKYYLSGEHEDVVNKLLDN